MAVDGDAKSLEADSSRRRPGEKLVVWAVIALLFAVTCWQGLARFGYSRTLPKLLERVARDDSSDPEPLLLEELDALVSGLPTRTMVRQKWNDAVELRWRGPFRSYNIFVTVRKTPPHPVVAVETNREFADHLGITEALYYGKDPLTYERGSMRRDWRPPPIIASQQAAAEALRKIGGKLDVGPDGHVLAADLHRTVVSEADLRRLDTLVSLRNLSLSVSSCTNAELIHVGGCTALTRLDLWKTGVTDAGLQHLRPLMQLESLVLVETQVSGPGLEAVGQLSNLQSLQLGRTRVADTGLGHLSGMSGLRELRLDESPVNDEGLSQLADLPSLELLDLTGTRVSGAGLAHLSELHALRHLVLERTDLTRSGLEHLTRLPSLRGIDLKGARLSKAGVQHRESFPSLEQLTLADTNLTDEMLASMHGLDKVEVVDLARTQISDVGLGELVRLPNLHRLDVSRTNVTGPGLEVFTDMPSLTSLAVGGTEITDESMPYLCGLTHLKELAVGDGAAITDRGLVCLEQLQDLERLNLNQSNAVGEVARHSITDEGLRHLTKLTKLKSLSLYGTSVTERGVARLRRALPKCMIEF